MLQAFCHNKLLHNVCRLPQAWSTSQLAKKQASQDTAVQVQALYTLQYSSSRLHRLQLRAMVHTSIAWWGIYDTAAVGTPLIEISSQRISFQLTRSLSSSCCCCCTASLCAYIWGSWAALLLCALTASCRSKSSRLARSGRVYRVLLGPVGEHSGAGWRHMVCEPSSKGFLPACHCLNFSQTRIVGKNRF